MAHQEQQGSLCYFKTLAVRLPQVSVVAGCLTIRQYQVTSIVRDELYGDFATRLSPSHPNKTLINFCNEQSQTDVWRHFNPGLFQFSWFNTNYKSRLDDWLFANHSITYNISSELLHLHSNDLNPTEDEEQKVLDLQSKWDAIIFKEHEGSLSDPVLGGRRKEEKTHLIF